MSKFSNDLEWINVQNNICISQKVIRGESRISCHWGQGLSNGVKDVLIFYLKSNLLVDERIFKEFLASYRGQLTPIVTHRFAPVLESK